MQMSQDAKKPCHAQHAEREKALNTQCKQSHAQHLAGALVAEAVPVATAPACSAGATLTWRGSQSKQTFFYQAHRLLDRQTRDTGREVLTDHQHRAKRLRTRETSDGGSQERGT